MEAYRIKNLRQNISDHFRCQIKIIPAPFVENADGTADGAGDHIGNFFLCMPVRPGIRCSFCNIMMEHSQHFFKQIIAMRRAQKTGQKRIFHGVPAQSQKIGTADIPVIFGWKFSIMEKTS